MDTLYENSRILYEFKFLDESSTICLANFSLVTPEFSLHYEHLIDVFAYLSREHEFFTEWSADIDLLLSYVIKIYKNSTKPPNYGTLILYTSGF